MSRIVVTDRFKKLREEMMNNGKGERPTLHSLMLRSISVDKGFRTGEANMETSNVLRMSGTSVVEPLLPEIRPEFRKFTEGKYLSGKIKKMMEISIDVGPKKLGFSSLQEAEKWSMRAKNTILSPTYVWKSDKRLIESSINGIAGVDDLMTKKYNKMLADENKIDKLCELHVRNMQVQAQHEAKAKEKRDEEVREQRKPLSKDEINAVYDDNQDVLDILNRQTKAGFREHLRMRDYQKKHYGTMWSKYKDYKI